MLHRRAFMRVALIAAPLLALPTNTRRNAPALVDEGVVYNPVARGMSNPTTKARFASDKGALRSGVRAAKPAIRRENYGSISPESGAIETETVEVTIYLCADATSIDQSMFQVYKGNTDVTSQFTWQWLQTSNCHQHLGEAQATGTVTLTPGPNAVVVYAYDMDGLEIDPGIAIYTRPYPGGKPIEITVSPASEPRGASSGVVETRRFQVVNARPEERTVTVSRACSGAASCTGSASQHTIASGDSLAVDVTYTPSGAWGDVGTVKVIAVDQGNDAADTGVVALTIGPPPETSLPAVVSPALVRRDLCLNISAGNSAALECGDLRIGHALPATVAMGITRIPMLTYSSQHASPFPLVPANVTLPSGDGVPSTVNGTLWVNGVQVDSRSWTGSNWGSDGVTRRVVMGFDASTYATGLYPITFEARKGVGGPVIAQVSDELVIVNRGQSAFGAGWGIAGIDTLLHVSSNRKLWISGDGSAVVLSPQSATLWTGPSVDGVDSLVFDSSTSTYKALLPDGGRIVFSSDGRHVQSRNRLAEFHASLYRTTFNYDASGRLTNIQLPTPASGTLTYAFHYNTVSGKVDSISAPQTPSQPRVTKLTVASGQLISIRDPGSQSVDFVYLTGANRIGTRRDRRDVETRYEYDIAGRVAVIRENATDASPAVASFQSFESRGIVLGQALAPGEAYSRIDGPRTDVADSTLFWLNGYGSARRIRNALGHQTLIEYSSGVWPAIATRVVQPNGFASRSWLSSSRPLVDSVTSENPYGDGIDLTTRYQWHATLPLLTKTIAPDSSVVIVDYDVQGKRTGQQVGPSSTRRVGFGYNSDLQLDSIQQPGVPAERLRFDNAGNLRKVRSPAGRLALAFKDAIGRDTLVLTPTTAASALDSAQLQAQGMRKRVLYDSAGRAWKTITFGPAMPPYSFGDYYPDSADTAIVVTTYDDEHRVIGTELTAGPDSIGLSPMWHGTTLDYAGRVASDMHGTYVRDAAGNVVRWLTQRGDTVRTSYDALNRLTERVIPYNEYPQSTYCPEVQFECETYPYYGALRIERNVESLRYDAVGNLTGADNNYARIARTYFSNGQLRTDSSRIRAYDVPENAPGGETNAYADFESNKSGLRFGYDSAGRRAWMEPPGGSSSARFRYFYGRQTGALDSLINAEGYSFRFSYNNAGQLIGKLSPGNVVETIAYEPDGYTSRRTVSAPYGTVVDDTVMYDGRGKVVEVATAGLLSQTEHVAYSGLGHVIATQFGRGSVPLIKEAFRVDAFGNNFWHRRKVDAQDARETRYTYGSEYEIQTSDVWIPRPALTCPGGGYFLEGTEHSLDAAGNLRGTVMMGGTQSEACAPGTNRRVRTASYYSADNRLRFFQRTGRDDSPATRSVYEEYRYDALGRRVMLRSRTDSNCRATSSVHCVSALETYLWDGDQLLSEARSRTDGSTAALAHYGGVSYTHAGGIDQPLALRKDGLTVVPHTNWRGTYISGTSSSGGSEQFTIDWPGQEMFAYWDTPSHEPTGWYGSLISGSRDNSGLMYRRNRYYDPATGRFTQEDPIGLAGGLNLYGYAGGDPVNYSDPFGLDCWRDGKSAPCPVFAQGATVNLVKGERGGPVFAGGVYSTKEEKGWYLRVGWGVGYDVSGGGEFVISESIAAFEKVSTGVCGGISVWNACHSWNADGKSTAVGVAAGPSEVLVSGHVEKTYTILINRQSIPQIPQRVPVMAPVDQTRVPLPPDR